MSEKEKQIIETFALVIPNLSESDKSYLLGLGKGMAIKVQQVDMEITKRGEHFVENIGRF